MAEVEDTAVERSQEDPGAARFGNFINYYSFNPPENRLKFLPDSLISLIAGEDEESPLDSPPTTCVLDIGCNAGDLTYQLYEKLRSGGRHRVSMLGIDLDPLLVQRAVNTFSPTDGLEFRHLDILDEGATKELGEYLSRQQSRRFDLVSLFSVTMWVHINHGDQGLRELVRKVADMARFVLLEPQPWKCYQTAARRMRKLGKEEFQEMKNLKLRGPGVDSEIVELFRNCGMDLIQDFGESKWNRKLVLLKKNDL